MSKGKKTRVEEDGLVVDVTTAGDTEFVSVEFPYPEPTKSAGRMAVEAALEAAQENKPLLFQEHKGAIVEMQEPMVAVTGYTGNVVTDSLAHEANYVMHCARRLRTIATIAGENPELASALTKLDEAETWLTRAVWRAGQA